MGRHGDPYGEAPPWDRGEYPADAEVPRPRRLRAALLLAAFLLLGLSGEQPLLPVERPLFSWILAGLGTLLLVGSNLRR